MELTKIGFKQTEVGLIPEDWEIVQLESKISVFRGGSPRPIQNYLSRSSEGINWIKIGDTSPQSKFIIASEEKIISEGEKMSRKVFPGDFLLSNSMSFGRPYILKIQGCIHDGWLVLQNYQDSFDTDFLYYILSSSLITNQYKSKAAGSSVLNLNKDLVLSISLITPPTLTEQKAIATALSDVDSLISSLDKLITKKKAIKQGAMQELLTPPHKGGRRLPGFSGDWEVKTIDELSKTFTKQTGFDYSSHIKPTLIDKKQRGYIPFIQNKDFDGHNVNFDTDYYIPEDVAFRFPRILLNERCLMISISGSIGKVGVFNNVQVAFIGGAVAVGKFHNPQLLDWVMYYLHSNAGQNLMLKDVKAGSHQNLILDDIRKMNIPIPDLNEQMAITKILSDMDLEIESLENKKAKYQEIKQGMMQELLTGKTRLI